MSTPARWRPHSSRSSSARIAALPSVPPRACTHSPPLPPSRLPSATPTSTEPPSPARRNKRWIVAQVVLTAVVFWYVARALVAQWREFRGVPLVVHPNWLYIIASGALFWATYAILVETLRRLLIAWD